MNFARFLIRTYGWLRVGLILALIPVMSVVSLVVEPHRFVDAGWLFVGMVLVYFFGLGYLAYRIEKKNNP